MNHCLFQRNVLILSAMAAGLLITSAAIAGEPGESLGRKYTTLERMTTEHLKAAHDDVQRIQSGRREVARQTGLHDYRSVLHAHAQDSAHTGGTLPEILADAKRAHVSAILLSNHYRPPRDFITDNWRGLHDGVLFIPGSETNGFLIQPMQSVMDVMDQGDDAILAAVTQGEGLAFLSHVEEREDHSMDGLTGMEIYNRHADAKDDTSAIMAIVGAITDPDRYAAMKANLERYPDELLAAQLDYPALYLNKWDRESQARPIVGVAANDCHHNQVFIAKMVDNDTVAVGTIVDPDDGLRKLTAKQYPGIPAMTQGHVPGDIVAQLDFDPYYRSFFNVSTHILAPELTESAIREALLAGHAYVSHEWMCDATGFFFGARHVDDAQAAAPRAIMGDEIEYRSGLQLVAEFPASCNVRLLRNGEEVAAAEGYETVLDLDQPGVYRVEGWLTVDGENRPWIYSNPIYVRP